MTRNILFKEQPPVDTGAKPKKRRPSKEAKLKIRPASVEALALGIQANKLDKRSKAAADLVTARNAVAAAPVAAAHGAVRDVLAMNLLICSALTREVTKPGAALLNKDGSLHPLLVKIWPDAQKNILNAARLLVSMEATRSLNIPKPDDDPDKALDVSSIIQAVSAQQSDGD